MRSSVEEPLPRVVVLTGKAIREYFEGALTEAGASLATWVVLYGIERGGWGNQRHLAKDLRIEGATLTRHLERMERDGLIVRTRDPDDRRQMRVIRIPRSDDQAVPLHALKVSGERGSLDPEVLREMPLVAPATALDAVQHDPGGQG